MRVAVVGGGLAGLAAALELVDSGHDVTLLEARPTLGGAVQTLPEREGDPPPPPDNGQHIALGCFTEYLRFLDRVGESSSYRRQRLSLPVVGEDASVAAISRSPLSILRYRHLPAGQRVGVVRTLLALRRAEGADGETFGALLRRLGATDLQIDRFWDVFVRPALNLRTDEASAEMGVFTVRTALLGKAAAADVILPTRPLGEMHGDAAGRALEAAGATVSTNHRVETLDELDADAIVVALPPAESARLLREPEPALEPSPIVSVHLLFDRTLLGSPLAALLDSPAHWVFDRGALTGHPPERGQYLTVVASGVPRPARDPRPRARRPDGRRADRPARPRRAALVARQPGALRHRRAQAGHRRRAPRHRHRPSGRRASRHVDGHGLAGDDGECRSQRPGRGA